MKLRSKSDKFSSLRSACQDRSERTRQRLIEVAVEVFSELGFEAASTRAIVERAKANLVSIPYYFGSKEGLYHAAAEHIGTQVSTRFRPIVDRASEALSSAPVDRKETLELYIKFVTEFAKVMLGSDTPTCWGQFISREQFDPTQAFNILYKHFEPMLKLSWEFVSRLTGWPVDDRRTIFQSLSVMAMVKFSKVDRATLMKAMGWTEVGPDEIEIISSMLRTNMEAMFAETRV